jgi:hypothetical protein
MKPEYELRKCVRCEVRYIEDCPYVEVDLEGKPKLPKYCYREDLVKLTPKPHNLEQSNDI